MYLKHFKCMKFQALTTIFKKDLGFFIAPLTSINIYRHFIKSRCFHFQHLHRNKQVHLSYKWIKLGSLSFIPLTDCYKFHFIFILDLITIVSRTDHVRNEEVLLRVKEQRNILHQIRKRKAYWIGHILRRNCLLHQVIKGKIKGGIEETGRQGRRRRKLLDDLNPQATNVIYIWSTHS